MFPRTLHLSIACIAAFLAGLSAAPSPTLAASAPEAWILLDAMPQAVQNDTPWVRPARFKAAQLDTDAMRQILAITPMEVFPIPDNEGVMFRLPHPAGGFTSFRIVESPIMEPALAAQFPEIKTYRGQGIDEPAATIRLDLTPQGFHAMVLSPDGDYFIDPYSKGDQNHYSIYYKRDNLRSKFDRFFCGATGEPSDNEQPYGERNSGGTLRNYRLAVAATVEYTAFHGGTVTLGQAAIVTAVNRVTGIYERDLCVRLTLVANNSNLVYTTTDSYTNGNGGAMLSENQTNVTAVIGSANYDIGHVFSTGGGGVAGLGVVCVSGSKARGVTGSGSPTGDSFWIDYVAHEMGHQFGGSHSFNGTVASCGAQRSSSFAYEPGSGSTIMSYAGICEADDIQNNSDAAFHSTSYAAIRAFVNGATCGTNIATGNTVPTVNGGIDYNIPRGTAFTLTPTASGDANGDTLTYSWEQVDLGAAQALSAADNGTSPIFRAFAPTTGNARTFPRYADVLDGTLVLGEKYPAVARTFKARISVRDNRSGGGGVIVDNVNVIVSGTAGPFSVSSPNTAVVWTPGSNTVTWSNTGTTAAPISTANVRILLSTDGGNTWPTTLLASTPNDGTEVVTIPDSSSTTARVRVEAVGNIYFDVSNVNFTITGTPPPATPTGVNASPSSICTAGSNVTLSGTVGAGETIDWYTGSCGGTLVIAGSTSISVTPAATTTYFARARRISGGAVSTACASTVVTLLGGSISPPTNVSAADFTVCTQVTITWTAASGATSYQIFRNTINNSATSVQINTDTASPYIDSTGVAGTQYFYWLKSVGACGSSVAFSNGDGGGRRAVPLAPAGVSATDGTSCSAVTISWGSVVGATGYSVLANTVNDINTALSLGTTAAATFSNNPAPGVTYFYWIRASNSCGFSADSSPDTGFVASSPLPPSTLTASDSTDCNQIAIAWSASGGATSYEVWRATLDSSGAATLLSSPILTSYNDATAAAGQTYYYFVKAVGTCGTSSFSVSNAGRRAVVSPVPTGVDATTNSCTQISISWSASTDASLYEIYRNTTNSSAGAALLTAVGGTSYAESSVTPGVDYYYFIKASNLCGESAFSTGALGRRLAPLASPAPVTAADGGSCSDVMVAWSSVPSASSYTLFRSTTTNFAEAAVQSSGLLATSYTDLTAQPGITYYYWVQALGTCGDGEVGGPDAGFIAATPAAPTTVAAADAASCNGVMISWNATPNADGYSVYRNISDTFSGAALLGPTAGTTFDDATAAPGTTYYYFVQAFSNLCGAGPNSLSDSGSAGTVPSIGQQPASLTVAEGGSASFTVVVSGSGTTYQWSKDNAPLAEDAPRVTGTLMATLTISSAQLSDAGEYSVSATNACGLIISNPAVLTVESGFPCPADFNQDGGVDGSDVEAFFLAWVIADPSTDVNQDGGVDGGDVEIFFLTWAAGGC